MQELVQRILVGYGFAAVELLEPAKGYRNHAFPARLSNGAVVNLILYKRESGMLARIRRANRVSDFVHLQGLPARHTIDSRITVLSSAHGESYAALYDYLPGITIPWEAYTQKHIKLLGKTLSDLHASLLDCKTRGLPNVADEYRDINKRMRGYFLRAGVSRAMRQKLQLEVPVSIFADFDTLLRAGSRLPHQQVLHMDFVRSNILFTETDGELSISGILDFEKTAYGSPLFDIARTLAFLLVDCKYKQPDKVRKYFLQSGYRKRGAMEFKNANVTVGSETINVLERLVEFFLVYDFYKFLRHNPYEYLATNEHFVRTKDMLHDAQLIQTAS